MGANRGGSSRSRASSADGITNSSGTEVARYAYDPYGNPLVSPAPGTLAERNPLRYRGYCFDAESGYYHMPARYYDPASARFLSVDPAAPSAGDPVSLNGYSYCFGDPVGLVDPDGRDVLYGEYYSDEQDPTGELDANLPDHDGAGAGKPPSKKVWEANNTPAAGSSSDAAMREALASLAGAALGSRPPALYAGAWWINAPPVISDMWTYGSRMWQFRSKAREKLDNGPKGLAHRYFAGDAAARTKVLSILNEPGNYYNAPVSATEVDAWGETLLYENLSSCTHYWAQQRYETGTREVEDATSVHWPFPFSLFQ